METRRSSGEEIERSEFKERGIVELRGCGSWRCGFGKTLP